MKKIKIIVIGTVVLVASLFVLYKIAYSKGRESGFLCKLTGGRWQERNQSYGADIKISIERGCYDSGDVLISR